MAALVVALSANSAQAATFNVTSTADSGDTNLGDGDCTAPSLGPPLCTLRAAVQESNAFSESDTINLPAGTYQLSGAANEDAALEGDLDLDRSGSTPESLTIQGAGARSTTIVGTGSDRVFHVVDSGLVTNMSGVTVTGGGGVGQGGGIFADGTFNLSNAAVKGNRVDDPSFVSNQGGGIFNSTQMNLLNVTISGNVGARGLMSSFGAQGAGVFDNGSPTSTLTNVTISNNELTGTEGQGGGMFYNADSFSTTLNHVTIAGNRGPSDVQGAGIFINDDLTFVNTIVASNRTDASAASNCEDNGTVHSSGGNLEEGTDCNFTASGDRRADPLLGPLQDNGGQTDTHALPAGSPAVDAASGAQCPGTDQRGVSRPQGAACDIGAFEFAPLVSPPPPPPPGLTAVLGRRVVVRVLSGRVLFAIPGGAAAAGRAHASQKGLRFRPLTQARELPVGSFLDTRRGKVQLVSARNSAGATQTGDFSSGLFQVLQSRKRSARGLTDIVLKGSSFRRCRSGGRGKRAATAQSRLIRRLRSSARGRFRTRGRHSAATVRGTVWLTADRCDGTLTKVARGRVAVRDFRRKRTVLVRAGKSYLAKAAR